LGRRIASRISEHSLAGKAAILPVPLPEEYKFTIPPHGKGSALIPPGQSRFPVVQVEDWVPDETVAAIKRGEGMALYGWGVVTYRDVFGRKRTTAFCHQMFWYGPPENEMVSGIYVPGHNRAS
jgi:hypothetical protein